MTFDLVTACFFHSTVELLRTEILHRAVGRVRPGGHLLVVSHVFESEEDVPPWAFHSHALTDVEGADLTSHIKRLMPPDKERAELGLDDSELESVRQEMRQREATVSDGLETATVKDGVLLMRRRSN